MDTHDSASGAPATASTGSGTSSIHAPIHSVKPRLEVRPFRQTHDGCTRWWMASGRECILEPPAGLAVEIGDLYLYTAKCTEKIYTWAYYEDG